MKKILSLVLALVMILSVGMLASCSSGKDSGTKGTDTATGTAADEAGKKTLKMATNAYFPPYEYYDGDKIVGIDADIAQAIADKLGMELVIEDMEFNSIISAVQSGNVDFGMAGMTVTEDRLKNVDFSESYATGVQVVIVKADSDYQKPEDLTGKKVGVQLATAISTLPHPLTKAATAKRTSRSSARAQTLSSLSSRTRSTPSSSTTSPQKNS